jgi:hypothetical protein
MRRIPNASRPARSGTGRSQRGAIVKPAVTRSIGKCQHRNIAQAGATKPGIEGMRPAEADHAGSIEPGSRRRTPCATAHGPAPLSTSLAAVARGNECTAHRRTRSFRPRMKYFFALQV